MNQATFFDAPPEPKAEKPARERKAQPIGIKEEDLIVNPTGKIGAIVTVRGTNGSGKSFVARRIKDLYAECVPVFRAGRNSPMFYYCKSATGRRAIIVGSYENDCGGCDSIDKVTKVYEIIKTYAPAGLYVFYEGLLHSADIIHTKALELPVNLVYLNTSLQTCLDSINARRRSKGKTDDVNPANPTAKYKCVKGSIPRARTELPLCAVHELDREAAFEKCRELLGL